METIHSIDHTDWSAPFSQTTQDTAGSALEEGAVVFFPKLAFSLDETEKAFLTPDIIGKSKNVSYNPANGELGGTVLTGDKAARLKQMIARFSAQTKELLSALLPHYRSGLAQGRTSFRPVEIAGRVSSWRKDDTRLHVDAFPSSPLNGRRIMRVFSNVNPERPRVWRVGEPFENMAKRFFPKLKKPLPGSSQMLHLLRITKSRRSEYDAFMLQLHDCMKADMDYQAAVPQIRQEFPPGSTWITFADQVSHAAMAGQHQFEQTYYLPVACMKNEKHSPLRVLERLAGRRLVSNS